MILTSDDFPCQRKFTQMSEDIKKFTIDATLIQKTLTREVTESQERLAKLETTLEERNRVAHEASSELEK